MHDHGSPAYVRQTYGDGTVVIDLVVVKTRNLIWCGAVKDVIQAPTTLRRRLPGEIPRVMKKVPENNPA